MFRILFTLSVVMLVSGTAWSAGGMQNQRPGAHAVLGIAPSSPPSSADLGGRRRGG